MVHGIAKLAIGGHMPFGPAGVLDFTDDVSRALLSRMATANSPADEGLPQLTN
jgi:hypothetical protein